MIITLEQIELLLQALEEDAKSREVDAGYSGSWGDNGAGALRDKIAIYRHGMAKTIPPEWTRLAREIIKQEDPEYKKFLELKKKFEK